MEKVQSTDGTAIAFERTGQGPALVLVVGAFCDRSSKKSLAAGLASRFEVYEYDRRGRGDSGDTGPYAIEREVEDLAAVIGAVGGPACVFGDSSGGALALEAAARGVPVQAVAVYEIPYVPGPGSAVADELDFLVGAGRPGAAVERFLTLKGTPPQVLEQMKAGPYWAHMEAFAPSLSREVRLCNDGTVPAERLAAITAPTLALAGGASPAAMRDAATAIAAAVSDGPVPRTRRAKPRRRRRDSDPGAQRVLHPHRGLTPQQRRRWVARLRPRECEDRNYDRSSAAPDSDGPLSARYLLIGNPASSPHAVRALESFGSETAPCSQAFSGIERGTVTPCSSMHFVSCAAVDPGEPVFVCSVRGEQTPGFAHPVLAPAGLTGRS